MKKILLTAVLVLFGVVLYVSVIHFYQKPNVCEEIELESKKVVTIDLGREPTGKELLQYTQDSANKFTALRDKAIANNCPSLGSAGKFIIKDGS